MVVVLDKSSVSRLHHMELSYMSFDPAPTTDVYAEWRTEAKCAEPENTTVGLATAWIDENHPNRDYAEQVCAECPVRFLCGLDAVQDPSAEGLRGGYYFSNGRVPHSEARRMKVTLGLTPRARQKTRKPFQAS